MNGLFLAIYVALQVADLRNVRLRLLAAGAGIGLCFGFDSGCHFSFLS